MNYFLFSGIPGIINISWIIVQYCPILSNSCQTIHFYFIHLAFLSLLHSREVSEYLLIHRMRFFSTSLFPLSSTSLFLLYLSFTTLSYTPPTFFSPILYFPYPLLSYPLLLCSSSPYPLLPYPILRIYSSLLSSTSPIL